MKRMTDITLRLLRKLESLDRGQGDRGPWCMCSGQINAGRLLTVDATDYLRTKPFPVCRTCKKPFLLIVAVQDGDAGRTEIAKLEVEV